MSLHSTATASADVQAAFSTALAAAQDLLEDSYVKLGSHVEIDDHALQRIVWEVLESSKVIVGSEVMSHVANNIDSYLDEVDEDGNFYPVSPSVVAREMRAIVSGLRSEASGV